MQELHSRRDGYSRDSCSRGDGYSQGYSDPDDLTTDPAVIFDALRRLPLIRLQQLLEDAGLPTFGTKDVLLRRITTELEAAGGRRGEGWDDGGEDGGRGGSSGGSGGGSSLDGREAEGEGTGDAARSERRPRLAMLHPARLEIEAEAAARAALLAAVADARSVCGWLAAARAQDLVAIDVR